MASPASILRNRLHRLGRQPGEAEELPAKRLEGQGLDGEEAGEAVQVGVDAPGQRRGLGRGRLLFRRRCGAGLGVHGGTVAPEPADGLWTVGVPVHMAGARTQTGPRAPGARIANRYPAGTMEHAMTHALSLLGVRRVMDLTGRSRSAVYAACDPNDPARHWGTLPVSRALLLAGAVASVGGRADLFALPFLRAGAAAAAAVPARGLYAAAARAGALYGRTAAALADIFDTADGQDAPVPLDARRRDAAVAAIDAQIDGLTALRGQLLATTALPPLPFTSQGGAC